MDDREQLLLELVNRARANPAAEAARYGIDLNEELDPGDISPEPKQPLAPNQALVDAARGHSQNMLNFDFFDHVNPAGKGPADRARDAGYPTGAGENIAWFGTGGPIDQDMEVYARHEALFLSPPHRKNMMSPSWRELGNGIKFGEFEGRTSIMVTENFGNRGGDYFITGVAFSDMVVPDAFYSLGEGLGNVAVTAVRQRDDLSFETTTYAAGGYSLQVPTGVYTVTARGGPITEPIVVRNVAILDANQKVDFNTRDPMLGSIRGIVFDDQDADGRLDDGEPGLSGRVVFVDFDGDAKWDPDEVSVRTDDQGHFVLDGLRAGHYELGIDVPMGERQTTPTDAVVSISLAPGQNRSVVRFGTFLENARPIAEDDVFQVAQAAAERIDVFANDQDADGQLDPRETLIHTQPMHGTIQYDPEVEQLIYTPEAGYLGSDFFVYTVPDQEGVHSNQARVDLEVVPGPGMLWRNAALPADVNDDGFVSPLDALLILNDINRRGARRLVHPDRAPSPPPPFLDPSGDGFVTPLDALLVLNELNLRAQMQRHAAAVDALWTDDERLLGTDRHR